MAMNAGDCLGVYEIQAKIGEGGMGEVYRATDTRLGRTVAIKVLPEQVASNLDLKQRFERETRTLAALNHPHICTLYDIGRDGDATFLVMEYLEGETLEERLRRGPLPLIEAVQQTLVILSTLAPSIVSISSIATSSPRICSSRHTASSCSILAWRDQSSQQRRQLPPR